MSSRPLGRRAALIGLGSAALSACATSRGGTADGDTSSPSTEGARRDELPDSDGGTTESTASADPAPSAEPRPLLPYEDVIASGAVASEAAIRGSSWAMTIRDTGLLVRGGTMGNVVFSAPTVVGDAPRGFDAGITQLLARYVLGDGGEELVQYIESSVETREQLLTDGAVDCVVATYRITEERRQLVDFAGPYYMSGSAIQVRSDDAAVLNSPDHLPGLPLVTLEGSDEAASIAKLVPAAGKIVTLPSNEDCVLALRDGLVDAYICEQGLLLRNAAADPAVKVVGHPLTATPYGIGLPAGSDAAPFVTDFLGHLIAAGTWTDLWNTTIGRLTSGDAPAAPTTEQPSS